MKKLLSLLLLICSLSVNAQINNLDEIELLGKWDVIGFGGTFSNIPFEYRYGNTPKYLLFSDGNYTRFYFPNNDWIFKGYILSHTETGKYILHLFPWDSANSIVNFIVTKFDDNELYLTTYDNKGWIEFRKSSSTDGIVKTSISQSTNTKTYNLSGVEVDKNTLGIVVKNGNKILQIFSK